MIDKETLFQIAKTLGGLPVVGCLRGTPAALAGVRYGDVLLSVNGQPTRTFGEYLEAKALRTDGMSAVVFRGGAETQVSFQYNTNRGPVDLSELLAELVEMRIVPDGPSSNSS